MPKVKLDVHKLENADVQFISLVDRGANRIPFKILKSDKGSHNMLDLGSVFLRKQDKTAPPAVVALIVPDSEALPQIVEALKAEGFKTEKQDKVGTNVIFTQLEEQKEGIVYKMSDEMAVVMLNVDFGAGLKGDKITSIFKSEGYYPNAQAVQQEASAEFGQAVLEGDKDKIEKAEKNLLDSSAYVLSVAKTVPTPVIKAEKAIVTVIKNYGEAAKKNKEMMEMASNKKKEEDEASTRKKAEDEAKAKELAEKGDIVSAVKGLLVPLSTQIAELSKKQDAVGDLVDEKVSAAITKATKEFGEKVEAVQKSVKEKIGSTLLGRDHGLNSDDLSGRRSSRKSEQESAGDAIDTAYMKRAYDGQTRRYKYERLN